MRTRQGQALRVASQALTEPLALHSIPPAFGGKTVAGITHARF
jgi:hypothetical protein